MGQVKEMNKRHDWENGKGSRLKIIIKKRRRRRRVHLSATLSQCPGVRKTNVFYLERILAVDSELANKSNIK